jgi:type III restriction enzyme
VVDALMKGDDTRRPPTGRVLINPVEMQPNPEAGAKLYGMLFESCHRRRARSAAQSRPALTALAHELASDGFFPGAGKLAHAVMHKVLDGFRKAQKDKIEAKRKP